MMYTVTGPTRKQLCNALEKSIRHWERMRDGKRRKMKDWIKDETALEEPVAGFCSLCEACSLNMGDDETMLEEPMDCSFCPVYMKTGVVGCAETPYCDAYDSFVFDGPDCAEFKEDAAKEVEFLKSLRPLVSDD